MAPNHPKTFLVSVSEQAFFKLMNDLIYPAIVAGIVYQGRFPIILCYNLEVKIDIRNNDEMDDEYG